ncbi:MAG: hypothetical protein JWN44_4082, partial [Myxococcales bacterium]|nr:hypothetical protein [Myxococcales bacterium]
MRVPATILFAISVSMTAGCYKEYHRDLPVDNAVVSQHTEELDRVLVESALEEKEGILYHVGAGD